jgi:hypothetical protein
MVLQIPPGLRYHQKHIEEIYAGFERVTGTVIGQELRDDIYFVSSVPG